MENIKGETFYLPVRSYKRGREIGKRNTKREREKIPKFILSFSTQSFSLFLSYF
jgi:hypothetical protein